MENLTENLQAADRLPLYERRFHKIGEIGDLLKDLANAFAGKGIDYEREFTANTRTALAKQIIVDELNFQFGRKA